MRSPVRVVVGVAILVAAVAAGIVLQPEGSGQAVETDAMARTAVVPTETVEVTRRDLSEEVKLTGTVQFEEARALPIDADGLITSAPQQDDIVRPGDELIRINDEPVTLAEGSVPLYRQLRRVGRFEVDEANDKLGLQEGEDVAQLQRFLLSKGFDDEGRLEPDGIFGLTTERAVKAWQKDVGVPATGKVDRSQLVFVDGPLRVDAAPEVGMRFDQVTVGAVTPSVQFEVTNRQRPFFAEGTQVSIESDAGVAPGIVTSLKRTTGADGSARHAVKVEFVSDAPAEVETTEIVSSRVLAENVTTVPVRALVALAEGGWAVQVETATGLELTGVELGTVVDGIAEIEGLDEGTLVVVPA